MNKYLFLFLALFPTVSFGQSYLLKTEEVILSFTTKNGKKVVLAKDKANAYIIYRYGTPTKVEFEFPDKSKGSWSKFKYSFYLRRGGALNEGMDLNYLSFSNENFKYTIYDTYHEVDIKSNIGIKVTNLITNKTTDIKGLYNAKKGTLIDFRENDLVEIVETDN